ncbi:phospho-sugar mutase [Spiroplasma chrysopicola]|uniref:Phosphoglucomutase/phosphomannomutase n=1 Tax=Spiroplasma chrysopicola DF-1 TaxID=1276227 RepID=R4UFD6_9MOLU|nr:phospho-sugar mutase [Spiroplasma chrysopicola]AGM24855.1 phosphoglucomutase/phosphomannomutase [Spiroplasma chrysopicola DF-1]
MSYIDNLNLWKNAKNLEPQLAAQFKAMSEQELLEAFSSDLEFGTAGLRGLIGPGTGKMNLYTIRRATLAFLQFLQTKYSLTDLKEKGVVIGHDNRHFSEQFAQEVADIFASNGIKAILFHNNDLRPTPMVSYTIRKIGATAGVIITASHNSREYNGYKIYDHNGSQFLPVDTDIIGENYLKIKGEVFTLSLNPRAELLTFVPQTVEENYVEDVKAMQFYPDQKRNIKIVFSNLHGTSKDWTPRILRECGYDVIIVEEQFNNDPDFTYAPNPNPELAECFDLPIKYAQQHDADIIILNDPDADRLGIGIRQADNSYYLMTGNETAPVLLEYLFSHYQKNNRLPKNGVMYNTFVTGNLSDKVAESYGIEVVKTLTGFKWIGDQMAKAPSQNRTFLFGFEEAYGYVLKDIVRDKDGIQASLVIAEACWYYHNLGKSFLDVLNEQYEKFGYYYCNTVNLVRTGVEGPQIIKGMLKTLREKTLPALHGITCVKKEDYLTGLYNMPGQDLLKFYFADGSWFAVRASGTEPKIKFYFVCVDKSTQQAKTKMELMYQELAEKYLNN